MRDSEYTEKEIARALYDADKGTMRSLGRQEKLVIPLHFIQDNVSFIEEYGSASERVLREYMVLAVKEGRDG